MRIRNNWLRSSRRYWPITLASILAFIVITKLLFNSSTQSLSVMSDMNVSEAEATHATKPTGVEDASQSVVSSAPAATPGSPSTSTPPFTTTTSTTTASSDAAPPPLMTDFTAIASTSSPGSAFLPSAEQSAPSQSTAPRVTASSTASPSSSSSSSAIEYLSKEELIGFTNKTVLADLQGMGFTDEQCLTALYARGVKTVEDAVEYLAEHAQEIETLPRIPKRQPVQKAKASATGAGPNNAGGSGNRKPAAKKTRPSSSSSSTSPSTSGEGGEGGKDKGENDGAGGEDDEEEDANAGDSDTDSAAKPRIQVDEAKINMVREFVKMAPRSFPYKMVLAVRTDVNMLKGKMMAQCAHAALGLYMNNDKHQYVRIWNELGQAKIVVKIHSRKEMHELARQASALGIPNYIVRDAGRTQVEAGTETVIAIGPGPVPLVNLVTGHLPLM